MATTTLPAGLAVQRPSARPRVADDDRPQEDRRHVHHDGLHLLPAGGIWRSASGPSWPSPASSSLEPDSTTSSSHARHDDDLPVRDAHDWRASPTTSCRSRSAPRTWPSRASTRCRSGCILVGGMLLVSALPVRRRADGGWTLVRAALEATDPTTRRGPAGCWASSCSASARSWAPSTSWPPSSRCARRA